MWGKSRVIVTRVSLRFSVSVFFLSRYDGTSDFPVWIRLTYRVCMNRGDLNLQWAVDEPTFSELQADPSLRRTVDVMLSAPMAGPGFLGVGWRSQTMRGAEIWVCRVLQDAWDDVEDSGKSDCNDSFDITTQAPLMCCVAPGTGHAQPRCATSNDEVFYELEIIDWCLTPTSASVTIRAPACDDGVGPFNGPVDCFRLSSTDDNLMDFITAFNPNSATVHGFMRRTSAQLNFFDGMLTQGEAPVVEQGLIATHGLFMLFGWMIMAPLAVFVSISRGNKIVCRSSHVSF